MENQKQNLNMYQIIMMDGTIMTVAATSYCEAAKIAREALI